MERIWRSRLQKLCRLRHSNHFIPDDDDGRAMLTPLLRFGLTDASAIEDAPWWKRRAKERAEKETMMATGRRQSTTPRQNAILEILIRQHKARAFAIMSVPDLMKEARKLHEFARVRNLRDATHETLDQLERKRRQRACRGTIHYFARLSRIEFS